MFWADRITSDYYYQCIPVGQTINNGNNNPDNGNNNNPSIITQTISTIFSIGGPAPTLVTTFITFLTPTPQPQQYSTITIIPDQPIGS